MLPWSTRPARRKVRLLAFSKLPEPESARDLAHQLGLELTEVVRPIATLTVRKLQ